MQDADGRCDLLYPLRVGEHVPPGRERPGPGPHLPHACRAHSPSLYACKHNHHASTGQPQAITYENHARMHDHRCAVWQCLLESRAQRWLGKSVTPLHPGSLTTLAGLQHLIQTPQEYLKRTLSTASQPNTNPTQIPTATGQELHCHNRPYRIP